MSGQLTWKQVARILKANKEVVLGDRVAIYEEIGKTFENSIIERPDNFQYNVSEGFVVLAGRDFSGTAKVGQKVRYNRYAKLEFAYSLSQGDFNIIIVPKSDLYIEVG